MQSFNIFPLLCRLFGQAFAGFLAGRTAGKVFGPAFASRLSLKAIVAAGLVGAAATQACLGLAGLTGSKVGRQLQLARRPDP